MLKVSSLSGCRSVQTQGNDNRGWLLYLGLIHCSFRYDLLLLSTRPIERLYSRLLSCDWNIAACVSSLSLALPLCAMNGLGLALVIPSVQSLTADLNASESRGRAFGSLWLIISFGGMLGALYATNLGAYKPLGIEGWRFVFLSVSVISGVSGILNHLFVYDPSFEERSGNSGYNTSDGIPLGIDEAANSNAAKLDLQFVKSMAKDIWNVMKVPTFSLIILQGIVGSIPYASLVFLTLYLQLLGMSDSAASVLVALYLIGGGLGGLLGGWIGDIAASRFPNHGRIIATQFSVFIGIPFALLIFKALPEDINMFVVVMYGSCIFSFALLTAWPAPCANNPIFAEIVPPSQRNLVYSFDRCFEGAVAAFATPLVGLMSEKMFGFSGTSSVSGDPSIDIPNAHALGNALLTFLVFPWLFCLIVYSSLHCTYPKDKHRAFVYHKITPSMAYVETVDDMPNPQEDSNTTNGNETMQRRTGSDAGSSRNVQLQKRSNGQANE